MAVGVLTAAPEFTKQIYDDVTEKMFGHASPMREDEAPEGLIVHSAGQGEQGYYVYDIWESREAFERFMEEKLGPALGEVMGGPPPEAGNRSTSRSTCWSPRTETLRRSGPITVHSATHITLWRVSVATAAVPWTRARASATCT